jgi:hypothetical protein
MESLYNVSIMSKGDPRAGVTRLRRRRRGALLVVLALGEFLGDLVHDREAPRPEDGGQRDRHGAVVVLETRLERFADRDEVVRADLAPVAHRTSLRRSHSEA